MNSRQRLINISCFIVWCGYAFIQTSLVWWQNFDREIAVNDALVSSTVLTISCFVISNALNYYLPSKRHYFYIAIWAMALAALGVAISRWINNLLITDPTYLAMIDQSLPLRFVFSMLLIAWIATINILWNIQQDYQENEERKADAEKLARDAELYNLRQQLQPHFLFNSLNSIIALIGKQPQKAREMTFQLSDFLRGTLRSDDQQFIALSEELEHIRLYLEIEKVRFGHRLDTHMETDEASKGCRLPHMILQPLVENAIKFGLYHTTERVTIEIHSAYDEQEDWLRIQISNPFDQEQKPRHKGTGFGLRGVQRRLFLLFGRTDLLITESSGQVFISTIKIPQSNWAGMDQHEQA